jgi:protoheme IX farnesyltransferase
VAAAGAAFLQIVLGGVVRVSGSGLGCPGWPLCPGLLPPGEVHAIIEYSHRVVGALASILILASAAVAWLFYRRARGTLLALGLAALLLAVEVVLGALTVVLRLPPWMVLAHLSTALLILGLLVAGATLLNVAPQARQRPPVSAWIAAGATFALALSGALVVGSSSSFACAGWPLCGGGWTLETEPAALIHLLHRFLAAIAGLALLALAAEVWSRPSRDRVLRAATTGVLAVYLVQAAVGGLTVWQRLPPGLRGLHLALASALWAAVVLVLALAATLPQGAGPPTARTRRDGFGRLRSTVGDYASLTKPRIIGLLLVTALGALLLPGHGWPPFSLVLLTLVGGGLAAASANTINCWLDRDIDRDMRRTRHRPIPAGRISPRAALVFGVALGVASFTLLVLFVNVLAAALAAAALLFYVLVYTLWLKRSTPQNIVIGGAAGAVPPLVAWAAVTHSLDLTALYLFAIIFFWTPPHFWALALLARSDYARAHVPMLPVVSGEQVTRRLIVLYSLVLVTVTVLLFVTRALGALYLVAALALGGIFIGLAVQTLRERDLRWAKRLFHYSIAYLAVLFGAMVADRMLIS